MGQQQLLLVILVTIIVGIATVVAINTFGSAAESANHDAVRQDVAQIASSAQAYYIKPAMLAGGDRDFTDIDFNNITFAGTIDADDPLIASNENGTYVISDGDDDEFTITAYPSSNEDYADNPTGGDSMEATILPNSITWVRSSPGEAAAGS
ncbi:MAG: protein of unknown function DUF3139 [Bacteroidetes bacterium HLUCCA01]|nr:MAG: protein of unknown function DUF3139 [Bacteroidetes bacterium HLUCCA01]